MEILDSNGFILFKDWTFAIAALVAAFVIALSIEAIFKRMRRRGQSPVLSQLGSSLAWVIYPIGLRIFVETAPLQEKHPKLELWLSNAVYVLFVVALLNLIRQAVLLGIEWSASRSSPESKTLQQGFIPLLRNVVTLFVLTMGGIMVLKHFNYDVMSLITALGVGSLAVGLAAKDTLSNMISGFTLIIDRNLIPGDRVNLGGSVGEVEEIGLRSTRIKIGDGNTLIVPNAELVNTKILNLSVPSFETTCSTRIRVPLDVPFSRVRAICTQIVGEVALARKEKGSWVLLSSLSDGNQLVTVGFWVAHMDDIGKAISDFHERTVQRFQQEKIPLLADPAFAPQA